MRASERGAYVVLPLTERDLRAVAALHLAGFGATFFLTTLGGAVLAHYYRTFLDDPQGAGFVCRERASGDVIGFVCGTQDLRRHYRVFLQRRLLPALPSLLAQALRHPRVVAGLLRRIRTVGSAIRVRRPAAHAGAPATALPSVHLLSMAVHPRHRGKGVGAMLVRAFTDEMARRGERRLMLGVRDDNTAARRLYERLGWRPLRLSGAGSDVATWIYTRDLDAPDRPAGTDAQPGG